MDEQPNYDFIEDVDRAINALIADKEYDVYANDLIMLVGGLFVRLRAVLTLDELHAVMHALLQTAEHKLQTGDALQDAETGEAVNMLLAEERRELGRDEAEVPDEVPAEWLDV